ncbi:hypothetical protein [Pyxidicoccus caerfyrddinensis]|uniref:hypothetical protein n=1 Tax=Pyxidicoccus caerfyrddinensis TaxID=2709663 RepID=UPI0013DC5A2E|nr:hypothetical protein [Pyxidicoccus caerfyrddinensis]
MAGCLWGTEAAAQASGSNNPTPLTTPWWIALLLGPVVVSAIVSGIIGYFTSRHIEQVRGKLQREVEQVRGVLQQEVEARKADLVDRNSDRAARRDYEYEARKRLYAEIEPLVFQLHDAVEEAYYRVISLARSSRSGNLGVGAQSWINTEDYYLYSTCHRLTQPVVMYRLLQRRMTFVDLTLDASIRVRYYLLKYYAYSFTDDFVLARAEPGLRYDPNANDPSSRREEEIAVYKHQGLMVGEVDKMLDAMLVKDDEAGLRPMTLGEFESAAIPSGKHRASLEPLLDLLIAFSSETQPVLARILLVQACYCRLILATYSGAITAESLGKGLDEFLADPETARQFAWRAGEPVEAELAVAGRYVRERLGWISKLLEQTSGPTASVQQ